MEIINFFDLDEAAIYGTIDPYSDAGIARFKQYCACNACHYYGRVRELFSLDEAVKEARAKGLNKVIVDDLS